ncbi:hypothetical protein F4604DRAFT_1949239 [Suillus subluteus]|nr:hypothetical protein F4604DRAFT_1949239 [Suillus subluteus]
MSIMVQHPRATGEPVIHAPAALDLSTLPHDDPATQHLIIVHSMVENGWITLLAALSFIILTNLSDELFIDVLSSYQALTDVAGMLALNNSSRRIVQLAFQICDTFIEPPPPAMEVWPGFPLQSVPDPATDGLDASSQRVEYKRLLVPIITDLWDIKAAVGQGTRRHWGMINRSTDHIQITFAELGLEADVRSDEPDADDTSTSDSD